MPPRGRYAAYLGLAATIAVLAGCGGSTTESAQPARGASTTTAPAAVDRVVMGEYYFRPGTITVKVGERVSFVNEGKIQHTVADTSASGEIRSRLIKRQPRR